MNQVTNQTFDIAWLNENYHSIMSHAIYSVTKNVNKVIRKRMYYNSLDDNSMKMCALYQALLTYNPEQSKFTTFLYYKTKWLVLEEILKLSKNYKYTNYPTDEMLEPLLIQDDTDLNYNKIICKEMLDSLEEEEKKLIRSKFWLGKSYKDISVEYGVSDETIRLRVVAILEKLKIRFKNQFES